MVSRSGVQNKKRMVVANPSTAVAMTLDKMPLAAMTLGRYIFNKGGVCYCRNVYLAFFVSSAMWPDASNPVKVPAVKRLSIEHDESFGRAKRNKKSAHKDNIQFHPGEAPVPLSNSGMS